MPNTPKQELLDELYNLNHDITGKNRPLSMNLVQRLEGFGYPAGYIILYKAIEYLENLVED